MRPETSHLMQPARRLVAPMWRRHAPALFGYLGLGLLVLLPLLPHATTAIPGGPIAAVDGWQNVWNIWWVQVAISTGRDPFVTDLLFYPHGVPLHLQTLSSVNALLALPITALWGPVAGYNAALLAALVLSGLAGYALALHVCHDRLAAFLAGAAFTLSPFHLTRVFDGQLELVALQWPACYALFLLRALAGGRRREALLAGLFLALTGLSSWYYLLFMALSSAVCIPLWLAGRSLRGAGETRADIGSSARHIFSQSALIALVGALLLLPVVLPAFATAQGHNGAVFSANPDELQARSTNLLDPWLPSYLHPLWGDGVLRAVSQAWHDYNGDWNVALGYSVLALAALGATTAWRRAWPWLALAGFGLLFALGPELQIGPWRSGLPLPYALLDALPGLSLGRRPHLFMAVVTLALVPPFALGVAALRRGPERRRLLLPAVALLLGFELLPAPLPLHQADVPPYVAALAGGEGAVLELPPARYKYVEPQRAQLVHGRPIFGGYLARPPQYPYVNEAPALRALWQMRPDPDLAFASSAVDPIALLFYYGVRDIVVRWDQLLPEQVERVNASMQQVLPGLAPVYTDETTSIYRVPATPLQPFAMPVGAGWHPIEEQDGTRWRWMADAGDILLLNPGPGLVRIDVQLELQSYLRERAVAIALGDHPLGTWAIPPRAHQLSLTLWLPPGEHRLRLQAEAEPEQRANSGRRLSVALLQLQSRIVPVQLTTDPEP